MIGITITKEELEMYPYGLRAEPGYEYIEVDACCFSNDHFSHPWCDPCYPDNKQALEAQGWGEIWGPHLTDRDWKSIFRRKI